MARPSYRQAPPGESLVASPDGGLRPVLWRDWGRRRQRRACIQLLRDQRVGVQVEPGRAPISPAEALPLARAVRAHYRLSWGERLARNARPPGASQVQIKLFGLPAVFAASLGLATA